MAELKNIRGNYLAQKLGNFPLDCECLNYAQKRDDISQALGCIGGDRVLLSGFNADGSGLVFVKTNECPWGEVMPVKAGSGSTLHLVSEPVRVDFSAEDVFPQAYFDRYLEYGTVYGAGAENFPVASFWKLRNNKVIYEALQAEMQTREAADSSLRQSVNSVSSSLQSEQSARDTAVRELKEQLLREIRSEVSSASSTAASSLSAEVTALNKRIADLESALSAQIANAQNSADTAADGLASTQYVNSQISTLTDKINTEITERKAADNSETADRKAADNTITAKVNYIEKSIVPKGVILMWSGTPADIPSGWALCDGQDGRPDLRGRFIRAWANDINTKGGREEATAEFRLTAENIPYHRHKFIGDSNIKDNQDADADIRFIRAQNNTSGSGRGAGALYLTGSAVYTRDGSLTYSSTNNDNRFIETDKFEIIPPYYALCYIMKL